MQQAIVKTGAQIALRAGPVAVAAAGPPAVLIGVAAGVAIILIGEAIASRHKKKTNSCAH